MGRRETWDWWRNHGYNEEATAAIMGNIGPESAFRSNNVEDRCPLSDEEYTRRVDGGMISRHSFCHDSYGYGLYQHTYFSRKAGLYDLCKKRGKSIADEECQHEWAETELHQPEYRRVLNALVSGASIAEMTREFMCGFERPADQSEAAIAFRVRCAQEIYNEFSGIATPTISPEGSRQKSEFWPPRTVDKSMTGPDIFVLQSILCARGYFSGAISGRFDEILDSSVKKFQKDHGLVADGIAGPKTWSVLLKA